MIVGTSHIAIESIKDVESVILKERPSIVALELDLVRFKALMAGGKRKLRAKDIFELGIKGFLFNLIGAWAEKKLGDIVNVKPGSEMRKAIEVATQEKIRIALIDQDIRITMRKLSKSITWKEKFRFVYDIVRAFIVRPKINIDLTKVPEKKLIKRLIGIMKKNYPSVYRILVAERNVFMAKALNKLGSMEDKVVAIVGAGHEDDIIKLLKNG